MKSTFTTPAAVPDNSNLHLPKFGFHLTAVTAKHGCQVAMCQLLGSALFAISGSRWCLITISPVVRLSTVW